MPILELKNLSVGYGSKMVQRDLNLTANEGDLICLIGRNGAGKSTLIRTIGCLQTALEGEVRVNGKDVVRMPVGERALELSMVLTDAVMVENLTVRELVGMGRLPYSNVFGGLREEDVKMVEKVIEEVNLTHKADASIMELSDGERQRVLIARALAQDTPVVLLDEPTSHLDLPNRIDVMLLLKRLAKETGKCFVVSMHELEVAFQVANEIWLMMEDGVVVGSGEELFEKGLIEREFASDAIRFEVRDGRLECVVER